MQTAGRKGDFTGFVTMRLNSLSVLHHSVYIMTSIVVPVNRPTETDKVGI